MKNHTLSALIASCLVIAPLALTAQASASDEVARSQIEMVAPEYPRAAERRGVEGRVTVLYTVAADGSVATVEIVSATPAGVFDRAALRAVENWRFEPAGGETEHTRELNFTLAG